MVDVANLLFLGKFSMIGVKYVKIEEMTYET